MERTLLHVIPGDTVRAEFEHLIRGSKAVIARVTTVKQRYGRVNNGRDARNPLVIARNTKTGDIERFDLSFVTAILARDPIPQPPFVNIFADEKRYAHLILVGGKPGLRFGPLDALVGQALASLPMNLPFPINRDRLEMLFWRDVPGVVEVDHKYRMFRVNWKAFQAWARRNALRICMTAREYDDQQTEFNRQADDDYWRELDQAMRDELDDEPVH